MTQGLCPLCEQPGCLMEDDPMRPEVIRYGCQTHCDTFRMETVFLRYVWSALKAKDKRMIAGYMRATKGPHRAAPLSQGDNYREYVSQGRQLQEREGTAPRAMAK